MSYSYTTTESKTFTMTHANYLASKVAADLKRMQRFYNEPSNWMIESLEIEVALLLKYGYLKKVTYGFRRSGNWIEPTLIYTASDIESTINDDPGKVRPGKNVSGASFYSYLEYTYKWCLLTEDEKEKFLDEIPLKRTTASPPGIDGYIQSDRNYSSGGRSLSRSSVRSYG